MRAHFFKRIFPLALGLPLSFLLVGCSGKANPGAEAPPKAVVEPELDANNFTVDHPEQFPLVAAVEHKAVPALNVTGVVQPDIARAVPVISLASGRVVEIKARLGDTVEKGQVLLRVRSGDVSSAYDTYLKAENDERLARIQLERAQTLYEKGAIAKSALEQAEDTEGDAKADLTAATEQLRLLGIDKDHPSGIVDITAPISGVITDQQVTNAAGVQGLSGPNPFTISDLSYVWIICDVYENDLDAVRVGQYADIHLNAYPNEVLKGRIDNILPILDPNIRTAKVRLEVKNPGMMRIGMFATATFYGKQPETRSAVPATAVLHLHDREWVYTPLGSGHFRRVEVVTGNMLPGKQQEIVSGIKPGDQVVSNALDLQNTVEQ
ncbi:Efflux transporter, RND family, MFP subunit [Candidatus Sulfotelmatobacter kueseliae]|uniref:Efflux transporter, RND family, MFP subunit n=1 Tax=Candidatus Sulfotelmatobacter kueseliae TaxID=2042962 RepID=A0A2U3KLX6_9BACT|nr:Efflux transporter, RND family, MFP subunit [Candidatus Sulfotelmatobacter kueseliae]